MRIRVARSRTVALAMLLGVLVVLALALLLRPDAPSPRASGTQKDATPSASADICADPEQVRLLIASFIDAYDEGQTGLADRFFATGLAFQWYSEQPLREGSVRSGYGNFGFVLDRGGTQLPSKGALDCASHKFIVWSIGPNAGPVP